MRACLRRSPEPNRVPDVRLLDRRARGLAASSNLAVQLLRAAPSAPFPNTSGFLLRISTEVEASHVNALGSLPAERPDGRLAAAAGRGSPAWLWSGAVGGCASDGGDGHSGTSSEATRSAETSRRQEWIRGAAR
jgi:hypothetical protein